MEVSLLSCPVCLKPHFQGVDALRTSLISVATTHISCPVCSELLLGLDKLTIHLFSHIANIRVSPSPQCDSEIDPVGVVDVDKKDDSTNCLDSNNDAPVCDAEMIDKPETCVVEEPTLVGEDGKSRLICDICNFHFSDETILDLHQKLLHQTSPDKRTGKYSYHCHLCSKQFKMRGSLMVHLRVAHFGYTQGNRRDVLLSFCGKSEDCDEPQPSSNEPKSVGDQSRIFRSPPQHSTLQVDKRKLLINSKSQDNKQWECEVCLKLFTTKYFLKKHKRLHTGEMPYYCSQCNKYFTFQQSYHKHMLYHSDDKPHICSECGRAFKELSTLHNHERIHSGERPFSCETCGKCFRQRVSYLVHRRIHTGAMPYKCTACSKTFRYKVSQRSHKCPSNPPGCVVRTPDLVEKLIQNRRVNQSEQNLQLKFNLDGDSSPADQGSIDEALEHFGFLEQSLLVTASNGLLQNEMETDLNESTHQLSLGGVAKSGDDCALGQEYAHFCSNRHGDAKTDVPIPFTPSDNGSPDFFALILSPVLSDVQSLCLSNYNGSENGSNKEDVAQDDALQTINEESFKELLYGSTSK